MSILSGVPRILDLTVPPSADSSDESVGKYLIFCHLFTYFRVLVYIYITI